MELMLEIYDRMEATEPQEKIRYVENVDFTGISGLSVISRVQPLSLS